MVISGGLKQLLLVIAQRATVLLAVTLVEMAGPAIAVRYLTDSYEECLIIGCWVALMAAPLSYALSQVSSPIQSSPYVLYGSYVINVGGCCDPRRHPFNTGCWPLSYGGNPGVHGVSHRGGQTHANYGTAFPPIISASVLTVVRSLLSQLFTVTGEKYRECATFLRQFAEEKAVSERLNRHFSVSN